MGVQFQVTVFWVGSHSVSGLRSLVIAYSESRANTSILLASSWFPGSFLTKLRTTSLGKGATTMSWVFLYQLTTKTIPTNIPTDHPDLGNPSIETLFSYDSTMNS